ncbi:MAG: helix-turn-helix domain-containing protein [Anaerolineae bacterium]|nr:helix-turn-helix domain-containing protein [Anaerolineae bacterium]NUQ04786.1 helix-turn-helix transcriptional regulator [Anaerolineae bacterium]
MKQSSHFGIWLRQRRKLLDLTQQQLANLVGCTSVTIRKLEAGERKPSQALAANLSIVLQVPNREHNAFIRFARTDETRQSFPVPPWQPDQPSWRKNQLPPKGPRVPTSQNILTMHYDVVAAERPRYAAAEDGRHLFEIKAVGSVYGDLEGAIELQYSQVIYPKPQGVSIAQALPMRVSVAFTIEYSTEQVYGTCTGMIYPSVDTSGNGNARVQASGHIISVTVGLIDMFLSRVFIEDEVRMIEGMGTGARGDIRLEPAIETFS